MAPHTSDHTNARIAITRRNSQNSGIWCIVLGALVLTSLLSSCHSTKKGVEANAVGPEVWQVHAGKAGKEQKKVIEEAYTWLGTPYKYAAQEKGVGTDCSGMVMKVFETATGEKLPRNSAKQAEFCEEQTAETVGTGDLIFFATGKDPEKISHVGIIIDDKTFIHASSSKGVVVSNYTTPYYQRTFRRFGRVPKSKNLVSSIH